MCQNPSYVWIKRGPEWQKVPAPCDLCWSCKENYVCDWVGRCLAEAATSAICCTLSLTYATPANPLDLSNRVVNPHHFQLFMKRLRKAGHKVRYLVAGEYGDLKGRAHFHAILFFKELRDYDGNVWPKLENRLSFAQDPTIAAPLMRQMPQQDMCHIREWPHGHVVADWSASEKSVRYCCEYLHHAGKKNSWFSMSKKPQLGAEWFAEKAERNKDLGVMPSSFEYLPPGGRPGKVYLMTGATRRDYLNQIVTDRSARPRMSKWVAKTFDKLERQEYIDSTAYALLPPQEFHAPLTPLGELLRDQRHARIANDAFMREQIAEAATMGFDDVEEYEAFLAHGGLQKYAEERRHRSEHVPGGSCNKGLGRTCSCQECQRLRAAAKAVRDRKPAPTRFDRQGRPQWGGEDAEYIASAFAREDGNRQDET